MPEAIVCRTDGQIHTQVDSSDISELLTNTSNILWLDIHDPNDNDISILRNEFHFHPLSIEDATREHQRPKIDAYDRYYFMVFYGVGFEPNTTQISIAPLYLFVGPNYLVSVHNGEFLQVSETIRRWRAPDSPLGNSVGSLLYALLDSLVDDYFPVIDGIADVVDEIEDRIFENFEESAIQSIFTLKRELLQMRRVVTPERDVVNVLLRREMPIFKQEEIVYLQDLYDHVVRVTDSLDTYRDLLSNALDSYLSLQSNQLNQVVKILTITSIVLMFNALVAGIYGMNFEFMPELHWRYGYAYALSVMVVGSIGLVFLFKRLKWI